VLHDLEVLAVDRHVGLVHGELCEEAALVVGILATEPVLHRDALHARYRLDALAVGHGEPLHERDLVAHDEPRLAADLDRLCERVEHAAQRAVQEQRHRHARHGEERADLVPEQVH
jgi:hypothetical protein